jgi:DNA-binding NarL/FixJ family response regulator
VTDMPAAGSDRIRVLIADDHALFRRGLIMVLEAEPDIEVVAEAQDGTEVIGKAEEFVPDVLLMDVRMPKLNGIEAARAIRESVPSAKIVMLTVSDEEDDLFDAIKAGANGYLLKEISIEEVADAIRSVVQGQSLISPSMASKLLNEFNTLAKQADEKPRLQAPRLTTRELEVLKLVAQGMSNRDVAEALFIAENTSRSCSSTPGWKRSSTPSGRRFSTSTNPRGLRSAFGAPLSFPEGCALGRVGRLTSLWEFSTRSSTSV